MKALILFCLTFNLYAKETFEIPAFSIEIKTPNVMEKVAHVIHTPENILTRYTPVGGKVRNKVVNQNVVSFEMTKKVLLITKTFHVNLILDISEASNICKKDQIGYLYRASLEGSDSLVTDNISSVVYNICIKELASDAASAMITGKIMKGNDYSEPYGKFAKKMIKDQTDPIVKAIKEEILSSFCFDCDFNKNLMYAY